MRPLVGLVDGVHVTCEEANSNVVIRGATLKTPEAQK